VRGVNHGELADVLASGHHTTGRPRQQVRYSSPQARHVLAQSEAAEALACPLGFPLMHSRMQRDQERQPEDTVSCIRDGRPICIGGQRSVRDATLVVAMLVV